MTLSAEDAGGLPVDSASDGPAGGRFAAAIVMAGQKGEVTADRDRAAAARMAKLEELHVLLAERVAGLASGADWQAWLRVAARLHDYSFNNVLLIAAQRPDATHVAGYRTWQALGRQVDKGERGLQILAPVTRRPADTNGDAGKRQSIGEGASPTDSEKRQLVGWRVTHVWDISQTSGNPLPEQPAPRLLTGEACRGSWNALVAQVQDAGFTVQRGECAGANGYTHFGQRVVRVREDVDDAQAVKTLAHELGHVLLHDPGHTNGTTLRCRGIEEVEAESVAYLVCAHTGASTEDYTFPYVVGWAAEVNRSDPSSVVAATGRRVVTTASGIISRLDAVPTEPVPSEPIPVAQPPRKQSGTSPGDAKAFAAAPSAPAVGDERLFAAHTAAAAWYRENVLQPDAAEPRAYLEQRGFSQVLHSDDPWRVGYAPARWTGLVEQLRSAGFTDLEIETAGLALRSSRGGLIDRFRDRIMLPIHDQTGQVLAFIGRAPDQRHPAAPKYLNSPNTAIYRKGEHLFGVGVQPLGDRRVVLVEGPLDVLAVHAAVPALTAVAPLGTALTTAQAALLGKAGVRDLVVAFDADPAGVAAVINAYHLLRPHIAATLAAQLPYGFDPAALAETTPTDLAEALTDLAKVTPLVDHVADALVDRWQDRLSHAEGRAGATRAVAALIATLPAEQMGSQIVRAAARIGTPASALTDAVAEMIAPTDQEAAKPGTARERVTAAQPLAAVMSGSGSAITGRAPAQGTPIRLHRAATPTARTRRR